jgi:hypothetical protein
MSDRMPSALVTDQGRRVHLRLNGRLFEIDQGDLRALLGIPAGPPGLGITIERDRIQIEFAADGISVKMSAPQLSRKLAKQTANRA